MSETNETKNEGQLPEDAEVLAHSADTENEATPWCGVHQEHAL